MTDPAPAPTPEVETTPETVADSAAPPSLEAQVALLTTELASMKDQALRALAEAENTRRRAQKEREDALKFGAASLAKELLGVADTLQRALEMTAALTAEATGETAKNFIEGVAATERQLQAAFERAGIKKIEPLGQVFDPNFHRVMQEVEAPDTAAGTVLHVLQAGYVIHDRLLREAMVVIAKAGDGQKNTINTNA